MDQTNKTAKLSFGSTELELPMYSPTLGPDVIDISRLYAEGDVFTYDPGFTKSTPVRPHPKFASQKVLLGKSATAVVCF